MKKFSDIVSVPKAREAPVQKKKQTFKIAKSDDEQMLAFGWANISIRSDGEVIEDWQEDIKNLLTSRTQRMSLCGSTARAERCMSEVVLPHLLKAWYSRKKSAKQWVFQKERCLLDGGLDSKCWTKMCGKKSKTAHTQCSVLRVKLKERK